MERPGLPVYLFALSAGIITDESFFEAPGYRVGRTIHIKGDGSYDGNYELLDDYYWIEHHKVRHPCSHEQIRDFIQTCPSDDIAGLASYFSQALDLGRLILPSVSLYDFLPILTGRTAVEPFIAGQNIRYWTLLVHDIFTARRLSYRILEHQVSLLTCKVVEQAEIWSGSRLSGTDWHG